MTNLDKLQRLSGKEQRLLFQSILFLPVIHLALFALGYHRLRRMMERWAPLDLFGAPTSERESLHRARETARIVSIAAQHGPYKATCLRRSLLLWWFLRREGIPGEVRFGVRKCDGRLEAHAWVECHGVVVNDSAAVQENYQSLHNVLPSTNLGL
jgi:hypothetical protein